MILEKVIEILSEVLDIDESDITEETKLTAKDGVKPIDLAKIIIMAEEKFNISIYDEYVSSFKKVKDIAIYIERELDN